MLAEYREITRVSKLARPLEDYGSYTMGQGHVKFFYDKGKYLEARTEELYRECVDRGFNVQYKQYKCHNKDLHNDWEPTIKDIMVNLKRIKEKVTARPNFYTNKRSRHTHNNPRRKRV